MLFAAQGDYIAAQAYYEWALEIMEEVQGENDPIIAICMNNL